MEKVLHLKKTIEQILNDNKAIDVSSVDLKDKSSVADYMIVASGSSSRHLQALSEMILEKPARAYRTLHTTHYLKIPPHPLFP